METEDLEQRIADLEARLGALEAERAEAHTLDLLIDEEVLGELRAVSNPTIVQSFSDGSCLSLGPMKPMRVGTGIPAPPDLRVNVRARKR